MNEAAGLPGPVDPSPAGSTGSGRTSSLAIEARVDAVHRPSPVLTLTDVATRFAVSSKTVVNVFVRERGLRAMHLGRQWRFRIEDVEAFERENFVNHGRRSA